MIYLDYAASSPPFPAVAVCMQQTMLQQFGNPGALHCAGADARKVLQESRRSIAALLKVQEREVFFTSGGTESNNWAVKTGCLRKNGRHIVAAATEHKSVLQSVLRMQAQGYTVSFVYPGPDGCITPETVEAVLRPDTCLLCVQAVNNETGVIQDVAALAALCRKRNISYHCDSVQSFGHVDQPLNKADFISLSAHKLGGPRGVGCLVVRYPNTVTPLLDGGGQELSLRSGTENLPGIAGFALAAQMSVQTLQQETLHLTDLSRALLQGLREAVPRMEVNGEHAPRHPGILNCRFPGIPAEEMVMRLDLKGICTSPGAACAARDPEPSHVLLAMGLSPQQAKESVRFSPGRLTTMEEIEATVAAVSDIVRKHS